MSILKISKLEKRLVIISQHKIISFKGLSKSSQKRPNLAEK